MIKNLNVNKRFLSLCLAFNLSLCPNFNDIIDNGYSKNVILDLSNFDNSLDKSNVFAQTDERWSKWPYTKNKNANMGSAGCGPMSIINGLSLAFGLDGENVESLLKNVLSIGSFHDYITYYLLGRNNQERYQEINKIVDTIQESNYYGANDNREIYQLVDNNYNSDTYILGKMHFGIKSYDKIIAMIEHVYDKNPNTNLIFYSMTSGYLSLERAFGSISNSGHYITLLVNAKEFIENDTIYVIDSYPRNLKGETYHKVNYNFVEKPNCKTFTEFNNSFAIKRINEEIIKLKSFNKIDKHTLELLGLEGKCGLIIGPNNLVNTKLFGSR